MLVIWTFKKQKKSLRAGGGVGRAKVGGPVNWRVGGRVGGRKVGGRVGPGVGGIIGAAQNKGHGICAHLRVEGMPIGAAFGRRPFGDACVYICP